VRDFLKPVTTTAPRPTEPAAFRYVRSFLILRVAIGALGVGLPLILVLGDGLWFDGDPFPRHSLSAYYYSGVRDVLVGTICAIGTFLLAYKVAEQNLDNTLSVVAGATAIPIALFPPHVRAGATPSPLQERLGESVCAGVHFAAAATFLISLAVLSVLFGVREGGRNARPGQLPPKFWRIYHWSCAGMIVVALLWMGLTELLDVGPSSSLLYGETVSLMAFGASWLAKGLEIDMLRDSGALAGEG
jgi:hypothetical protein